jgi:hypothetical protein
MEHPGSWQEFILDEWTIAPLHNGAPPLSCSVAAWWQRKPPVAGRKRETSPVRRGSHYPAPPEPPRNEWCWTCTPVPRRVKLNGAGSLQQYRIANQVLGHGTANEGIYFQPKRPSRWLYTIARTKCCSITHNWNDRARASRNSFFARHLKCRMEFVKGNR